MRWLTNDSHRDFFESHHHILFENLFKPEEINQILHEVNLALGQKVTPEAIFKYAHNLSHKFPTLKEIVSKKSLAKIAAELLGKRTLRFGYDQVVKGSFNPSLNSLQGILGGVVLFLSGPNKGNAIFFNQNYIFDNPEGELALIIGYTEAKSLYIHNIKDPHTAYLKSKGYVYGDILLEKTHPLLYTREL